MLRKYNLMIFLLMSSIFLQAQNTIEDVSLKPKLLKHAVIAHRGSTYWTPEETEAAFRWARNAGADYLEADIQRSKDGVLLALHDNNLSRTTNVESVYAKMSYKEYVPANFNYDELLKLDAGSWFNEQNPDKAKLSFSKKAGIKKVNQQAYSFKVLKSGVEVDPGKLEGVINYTQKDVYIGGPMFVSSLEDLVMISKGWMPARDSSGVRLYDKKTTESGDAEYTFYYVKDPADNGNRPGIYLETKEPDQYPGIEEELYNFLESLGYIGEEASDSLFYKNQKVNTGNTDSALILQTFSENSLLLLNKYFGDYPICFLLWLGDPNMPDTRKSTYKKNLEFAAANGANIIGPSIAGEPNNYAELLSPRRSKLIRKYNFHIHAYSFDTQLQINRYFRDRYKKGKTPLTDSFFVNRSELIINNLIDLGIYPFKREKVDAEKVLKDLGY